MLYQQIIEAIPDPLYRFPKLTPGHEPYYFDSWDIQDSEPVLHYWFWDKEKTRQNKKRVIVGEISDLLKNKICDTQIRRGDFEQFCPKTNRDGGCGFAVIIRILEHLDIVRCVEGQYQIHDPVKALWLLRS